MRLLCYMKHRVNNFCLLHSKTGLMVDNSKQVVTSISNEVGRHHETERLLDDEAELSLNSKEEYLSRTAIAQSPMGVCINLLASILFIIWQWNNIPEYILLPWSLFINVNLIIHLFLIYHCKKQLLHEPAKRSWSIYNGFLFCTYALAWGIGYHLFFPYLQENQQLFFILPCRHLFIIACTCPGDDFHSLSVSY